MPQHWIGRVFFARGVSPGQKWWPSLFGREISCSQWEGPSMHSRPCFFSFCVWGGGICFSFFRASQCVGTMFPSSSQWVPNIFPNMFSIPPHFYPICLGKWCPPFTYIRAPKGRNYILQNIEPSVLGSLHSFISFEWWANQIGTSPKKIKIKNLGGTSSN